LFLDGGDDAFYSLAMLHYVERRRPDAEIHDRGGLIYKSVYGSDFRSIPKPAKKDRRIQVERTYLQVKNLFYATMDEKIMPGVTLEQVGILQWANPRNTRVSWPLILIRSVYPLVTSDYRTRALGVYFPYMQGRTKIEQGALLEGLSYLWRSKKMGYDIDWLENNLKFTYEKLGYDALQGNKFIEAEMIYQQAIKADPSNQGIYSNMGVVYERMGRWDDARKQYEVAMGLFPDNPKPVYNLAVWYWKKEKWLDVVKYLEEVLRRDPGYPEARKYLERAKTELKGITN